MLLTRDGHTSSHVGEEPGRCPVQARAAQEHACAVGSLGRRGLLRSLLPEPRTSSAAEYAGDVAAVSAVRGGGGMGISRAGACGPKPSDLWSERCAARPGWVRCPALAPLAG